MYFRTTLFAAAAAILAGPLAAEELVTREILQQKPLSGSDDMVVIITRLTVKPGGYIPLHTHPGDEHAVIITGGLALMPNGKEVPFADGTPLFFSAGDVHGGVTNAGDADITILTTHVVVESEPFSSPAE